MTHLMKKKEVFFFNFKKLIFSRFSNFGFSDFFQEKKNRSNQVLKSTILFEKPILKGSCISEEIFQRHRQVGRHF